MNPALKDGLAALLVICTGPIGLIAIGIYLLKQHRDELRKQTQILTNVVITPTEDK